MNLLGDFKAYQKGSCDPHGICESLVKVNYIKEHLLLKVFVRGPRQLADPDVVKVQHVVGGSRFLVLMCF